MKKSKSKAFTSALKTAGIWFAILTITFFIINLGQIGTGGHPRFPVYGGISVGLVLLGSIMIAGVISIIVFIITYLAKSNQSQKGWSENNFNIATYTIWLNQKTLLNPIWFICFDLF